MNILEALQINNMLFIQIINLLMLLIILKKFLADPLQKTINKRQKEVKDIEKLKQEVEKQYLQIKEEKGKIIKQAKEEAKILIETARKKAQDEARLILEEAKQKAEEQLTKFENYIKEKEQEWQQTLNKRVSEYTLKALHSIIGKDTKLKEKFVDQIIKSIK